MDSSSSRGIYLRLFDSGFCREHSQAWEKFREDVEDSTVCCCMCEPQETAQSLGDDTYAVLGRPRWRSSSDCAVAWSLVSVGQGSCLEAHHPRGRTGRARDIGAGGRPAREEGAFSASQSIVPKHPPTVGEEGRQAQELEVREDSEYMYSGRRYRGGVWRNVESRGISEPTTAEAWWRRVKGSASTAVAKPPRSSLFARLPALTIVYGTRPCSWQRKFCFLDESDDEELVAQHCLKEAVSMFRSNADELANGTVALPGLFPETFSAPARDADEAGHAEGNATVS